MTSDTTSDTDKPLESQAASAVSYDTSPAVGADGRVLIGQDVEIFSNAPCPDFSSFAAPAFEAKDRRAAGDQFALLCGRENLPRMTMLASYKNLKNPHILRLLEAGIVDWKPEGRQKFALVFEKPAGRKLQETLDDPVYRLPEDRVISALIQPILSVLVDFRNADLVHGAINTQNIFVVGAMGAESIVLGECLSTSASLRQHAFFETIERGMASPAGRGQGTIKDDLYALGMCVAMIVRGENLAAGKTEQQIIEDKLEKSSYGIVTGRDRLPAGISEFLRGVLNDDEAERWDLDDTQRWLEGRRATGKQPGVHLHAARPFTFHDRKHWDLRSIAYAFSCHVEDAATAIERDQFDLWIKRNFEDKDLDSRLEKVWEREKSGSREKLVSSVVMALDPAGPMRYKGISAFPAGFGTMLAHAMARGDDIQFYAEIIQQQLFNNWINQRGVADTAGFVAAFEKCRNFLAQKMAGYGVERALYILNKDTPCMSPMLRDYFVMGPASLMIALEKISMRADKPDSVLDRHMLAFISVREPKMIDPHLGHVISHDRGYQLVGVLRTLAAMQKRFSLPVLPGIGNWMISLITPAVNRYNDHELRQEVAKRMNKLVDSGNLQAILDLVDDARLIQDDQARFTNARQEYTRLSQERDTIEANLKKKKNFGYATGRQMAMMISAILAVVLVLGYIILHFTGGV